jgi:transcription initiation factor TFIID subunit 8
MCENFSRELVKVVIAQITQALGFHAIQQSASESLADILQLYIEEIGYSSHLYAEQASRIESNFYDISQTFQDLGVSIQDLYTFQTQADEIPFAKAVPPFPLPRKEGTTTPSTAEPAPVSETQAAPPAHIPPFLPPFPALHTYSRTPIFPEVITDPRALRRAKGKQKRQLERSLYDLAAVMKSLPAGSNEARLLKHTNNPFLSPAKSPKSPTQMKQADIPTPPALTTPAPTPITDLKPFAEVLAAKQERDEALSQGPVPIPLNLDLDDSERARKRAKCEKILALSHQDGIVEALDTNADHDT